jgi:transglutaminase-like putative cysteine protease
MLLTVAWSIEAANWTEGLGLLQGVVVGALIVGLILVQYRVPGMVAHLLSLILGAGWSLFLVGRLLDPASVRHRVVLLDSDLTWRIRLTELMYRFQEWLEIARGQGVARDNLIFVLQMAFLIWLVSYSSVWLLFRMRSVWGAILPSSFAMLVNLYYASPELYIWMALYLLCALLLIVRSNLFLQEQEWRQARIGYAPDISFDFLRDGVIFAILVVLLAWIVPTASASPRLQNLVDRFNEPVYQLQREFNRLFSSLNYKPLPGPAYFGDTMMLSGPVNLSDTPIFDAVTTKGRYWRGVVYDQYTGRGWVNTGTSVTKLEPGDPRLKALDFELREPVTQTIRVLQPGFVLIHALPQPLMVDVPVRAQYSPVPLTTDEGVVPLNVSALFSRQPLNVGDTYTVVSSVSVADEQSLRRAGTDYPDWIREKYLQLPDSLPPEVRELAQEITAPYDNPYDKAVAIESYLRKIRYDENIPGPPPGVDGVAWFLFDERAGYCDYYASAFAVLARSVGIPTRVAAGYSLGDYEPEIKAYRQREFDAHSWPEVFFPRYGWIEFEPTAADPRIVRPAGPAEEDEATPGEDRSSDREPPERRFRDEVIDELLGPEGPPLALPLYIRVYRTTWARFGLGLTGVLLMVGLVLWVTWQRSLRGLSVAEGFYARMTRVAEWLGVKARPSQTPHEYAGEVARVVPQGRPAIWRITEAFVRERFAGIPPAPEERASLVAAWLELRRALFERLVTRIVQFFQKRLRDT